MDINKVYSLYKECSFKVCTDTRNIVEGALFIALRGDKFDANNFIEEALLKGCKYAIGDNYKGSNPNVFKVNNSLQTLQELANFHKNQLKVKILAIAGSNGKTTTKELISAVLSKKYKISYTKGNYNNHIGVPLTILQINPETELAIVEMGANILDELEILCKIADPDYGIVTNVGLEHLEGFGSFEGVVKTETFLYSYLSKKNGLVFVNIDDNDLMNNIGQNKIYTYGSNKNAHIILLNKEVNPFVKINWKIKDKSEIYTLQTKLIGLYNAENILAAICVGIFFSVPLDQIKEAIEQYMPSNHRSQWIQSKTNNIIMDAYNANPTSMQLAIENFNALTLNNKVLILGDMLELGKFEEEEHKKILLLINQHNYQNVFLVGKVFNKFSDNNKYHKFNNVDELIHYLTNNQIKNSSILIKGSHGIHLEKLLETLTND